MKSDAISRLLPAVFQRTAQPGSPLLALLGVMERMHAPSEQILRHLASVFNPRTTPDRFLPYLSRWVNLDWVFEQMLMEWQADPGRPVPYPPGLGSMRELVALGFRLNRESGTAVGLARFLTTASGMTGFAIEENPEEPSGAPMPYHIRVKAPAAAAPYRVLLQRIVEMEKPAYVTYELLFESTADESDTLNHGS